MSIRRTRISKPRHFLPAEIKQKRTSRALKSHAPQVGIALALSTVLLLAVHFAAQQVLDRLFYRNPDFTIKTIEVQINGSLSRSEVLDWAGVQPGLNLMQINLVDVRRRLTRMPNISTATVSRRLPHTLRITVEERQPIARIIPFSTSGHLLAQPVYYIDEKGMVMKPKPGERLKPLPIIRGVSHDFIREGERTTRPEVLSALNLIRISETSSLKGELDLTEIEIQGRGNLLLRTRDQGRIIFRTDFLPEQIQRLRTIFDYARQNQLFVRTVDLTPERNVPVTFF